MHKMTWHEQCEHEAGELTKEKRQQFLDMMHAGKTLGAAREECGISLAAACGVMDENIEQRVYKTLRTQVAK